MSGFLVLIGCLAVATLIAIPSFARANATLTAASQTSLLTREIAAPIYVKYTDVKGEILPDPQAKLFLKLDSQSCQGLTVHARKAGGEQQGVVAPALRKAGGEQEEFTTPATSDGKGGCKYEFSKIPGDPATWSFGVADVFLGPTADSLASLNNTHKHDPQFIKLEQQYQQKLDKGAFLKTYVSEFSWTKGASTDLFLKGDYKEIKIDGKTSEMTLPLYLSNGGGGGAGK